MSRFKSGTTLWTKTGEPFDLNSWLMDLSAQGIEQTERWLYLGTRVELKARLMVPKRPPEVANRRRAALKKRQKAKGKQPSQRELAKCDGTRRVTNVPEELLGADEALIWYAARWQIERLFKLWKNQAQRAQSRSNQPWRRLCEIYCKLIGVLVQYWISLAGTWRNPRRRLVKAAQVVPSSLL